jgi:hypothetical protein
VDAFHGTRQRHCIADAAAAGFGGGEGEDGTDAFSAGKQAVSHGLMERGGFGAGSGEVLPEGAIHLFGPLPGVFLEVKSAISRHARVLMPTGGGGNARFSACTLGWSLYFPLL